ncbi:hypothetical protein ACE1ET_01990 [Saccharicrinis sp. FJH62]|uniref:hypothetical protein n=1 Tax=Saccharicrinis sp. FJH62 TaxID=3344657 RepID=UPI0035D49847
MKKIIRIILYLVVADISYVNAQTDSLIRFSDLKYYSDFEKDAIREFVKLNSDTFNLFMAIDEKMTPEDAAWRRDIYSSVFEDLYNSKVDTKKINKKIKLTYSYVHDKFLKKYNDNVFFPVIFHTGVYNCVTASMLYAMIFDQMGIPYSVKASSNHVYLVANPGPKSIVIETTNPGFEQQIFTGEFKQQYVNYLRTSKMISESEYKNKSVEEIFEEKFNEVRDAEFRNLPGFQYYNKALMKLQNNETNEALDLCQKAYFFYPDNQVKTLLNTCLLFYLEKCNFDKVSDIDYLAQLSRFENTDQDAIVGIFNNIIYNHLQYTGREPLCDSLNVRLVNQISEKKLADELSFTYNLQMAYRFQNSDKIEKYVANALDIKGNHRDARIMMENYINRKLYNINNSDVLLDTLGQLIKRYDNELLNPILHDHKLRAYLQKANDAFGQRRITEGNKYLLLFEKESEKPVKSKMLIPLVENTYRTVAVYYFYKGNKFKAESYIDRGLDFVPHSRLIQSAVYSN